MVSPIEKAKLFRSMHIPGRPLVLFNIWDVGSARAVAASGAQALATGSWSVAKANGFEDGEQLPVDIAISNIARIAAAVELPVSIDLESGYGGTAEAVGKTIERSIEAGAIGCNIEDSDPGSRALRSIPEQVERIRVARRAADTLGVPYFINMRTDVFFAPDASATGDDEKVAEVLERARAYAAAGADGLFVPGVVRAELIERLAKASPMPFNVMVGEGTPSLDELAQLGVARVSHGPGPYLLAMNALQEAAREEAFNRRAAGTRN